MENGRPVSVECIIEWQSEFRKIGRDASGFYGR